MPRKYIDQMGYTIELSETPQRVISLVPSHTETLIDLGLAEHMVGRTLFCIHPEKTVAAIPKVGGTKKLQLDKIRSLQPDLVIGNKEENSKEQIEQLQAEFPVWMSDVNTPQDSLDFIHSMTELFSIAESTILKPLAQAFEQLEEFKSEIQPLRALYLIWKNPYMVAGKETYIDSCLEICGFSNAVEDNRYPTWNSKENKLAFDCLLLSSEPYPFNERDIQELKQQFPDIPILLVDGEMFSWYGSRQLGLPDYVKTLHTRLDKA